MKLAKWNTQERVKYIINFMSKNVDFKSKSVLDIGCNTGHLTCAALSLGASSVVSVDRNEFSPFTKITSEAVAQLRFDTEVGQHKSVMSDIFDFDIVDFDIVLCCGVIYHTERQLELIQKCSAAKHIIIEGMCNNKKESVLFMSNLLKAHPHWEPSDTYHRNLFKFSGLEVVDHGIPKEGRIIYALTK